LIARRASLHALLPSKEVPCTPNVLYTAGVLIKDSPKIFDRTLESLATYGVFIAPDVLLKLRWRYDLAGVSYKVCEKLELGGWERNECPSAECDAALGIKGNRG
jgi:hypothetical protein